LHSFDPAEKVKAITRFIILTHRNIDSWSLSPQKSSFCSIFSSTFCSTNYIPSIYRSHQVDSYCVWQWCLKIYHPELSDFVDEILLIDAPIQGLSASTKIKGPGRVKWQISARWELPPLEASILHSASQHWII